jgi:hypothetical protein
MWWDIRKLSESVESMPLREKGSETNLGGIILEYDPTAGPTNFMVGTEQVSRWLPALVCLCVARNVEECRGIIGACACTDGKNQLVSL